MLLRKERTMDVYREAGAWARLLSEVGGKAVCSISQVLRAKDSDRMMDLLNKMEQIISRADTQLFTDYPELGHEGTAVFYGALDDEPENDLDKAVINEAEHKAISLFGDNVSDGNNADL